MSKLGRHDNSASKSYAPDKAARAASQTCAYCATSAIHRCAHCSNLVCDDHYNEQVRFHWQRVHNSGTRVPVSWQRYVPNGTWHVCPRCAAELHAQDAREHAKDRRMLLRRRIFVGTILIFVFSLNALAIYLRVSHVHP